MWKELLYADDLVLCGESITEVMDKNGKWKNVVEGKSLRVNVDKTKGMQLLSGKKSSVLKADLGGVCSEHMMFCQNIHYYSVSEASSSSFFLCA